MQDIDSEGAPDEGAPWDLLADALTSLDEIEEEEDPVLDVREAFGDTVEESPLTKVPLERAKNLMKVRNAVENLLTGRIEKMKFLDTIRPMERALENGLKVVTSGPVQKRIAELPEEERFLYEDAHEMIIALQAGLKRMLLYRDSDDLSDVKEGLVLVEEAFLNLDEIQDDAIEIAEDDE